MKNSLVRRLGVTLTAVLVLVWGAFGASVARAAPPATAPTLQATGMQHMNGQVRRPVNSAEGARNAVLAYMRAHYADTPPADNAPWVVEQPTLPPGGALVTYSYGGWVVEVAYPVVPAPTYTVNVTHDTIGFVWDGTVAGDGRVTVTHVEDPMGAWYAAVQYVRANYANGPPTPRSTWYIQNTTPPHFVGGKNFRFTVNEWTVDVSYPVALPPGLYPTYDVEVLNAVTGFNWRGTVDSNGKVTPGEGVIVGMPKTGRGFSDDYAVVAVIAALLSVAGVVLCRRDARFSRG